MKINISAGQADTPVGLLTLFRVMEQGINTKSGKVTTVDPPITPEESDIEPPIEEQESP
ncbi:MAG: hypothetical protein QNJ68_07095 [Microcoleaceae cyanobacterium MO_207.B10]|nr:hypothetical protein [Microcoleaceae cyanobacterium MO_207.B10]